MKLETQMKLAKGIENTGKAIEYTSLAILAIGAIIVFVIL